MMSYYRHPAIFGINTGLEGGLLAKTSLRLIVIDKIKTVTLTASVLVAIC